RPRGEGIERAELAAVARRPWRIFVAEPEVQAEAAVHAEVVLHVEVPIGGLAAERIGGERTLDLARVAEHEVGKGVAGAAGAGRVLGRESVVGPDALVLLAVREVRQPAPDLGPALQDVAAADLRDVVRPFE